jgi:uncharacterized protein (DUF2062 family)
LGNCAIAEIFPRIFPGHNASYFSVPRKFLKKYLPSHDSIRQNRFVSFFGTLLHHPNLWHLHRRSVAGGVAAGLFAGLIPGSNPVQFFFATLFSVLFKVNLPLAVFITLYSNPFTIVPLYLLAFTLGRWVTGSELHDLQMLEPSLLDKNLSEWLPILAEYLTTYGKPLITGLVLLASLLAVCGYMLVRMAWRAYIVHAWHKRARQQK